MFGAFPYGSGYFGQASMGGAVVLIGATPDVIIAVRPDVSSIQVREDIGVIDVRPDADEVEI